jgi:hypothetical protein
VSRSRRTRATLALGAALVAGVGFPLADVALKCRASSAPIEEACPGAASDAAVRAACPVPTSEACVWGKSLLPVSIGAALLLLGLPAGALAFWASGRGSRAGGSPA